MAGPSFTVEQLQARYDALWMAYTAGVLKGKYADEEYQYFRPEDMLTALNALGNQIDVLSGQQSGGVVRTSFSQELSPANRYPYYSDDPQSW